MQQKCLAIALSPRRPRYGMENPEQQTAPDVEILVNGESANIFNGVFESPKSASFEQIFARFSQFQTGRFLIYLVCINYDKRLRKTNRLLRNDHEAIERRPGSPKAPAVPPRRSIRGSHGPRAQNPPSGFPFTRRRWGEARVEAEMAAARHAGRICRPFRRKAKLRGAFRPA